MVQNISIFNYTEIFSNNTTLVIKPYIANQTLTIITFVLALIATFTNSILLTLWRTNSTLRKDDKQLQVALAVGDVIMAVGVILVTVEGWRIQYWNDWFTAYYCLAIGSVKVFGNIIALTVTNGMAFDRIFAVVAPMKYRAMDRARFAYIFILASICLSLIFTGVGFYGVDNSKKPKACSASAIRIAALKAMLSYFDVVVGSIVVLAYLAMLALFIVKTKQMEMSVQTSTASNSHLLPKRELEVTRTVLVIVVGCILFYIIPNILMTTLALFGINIAEYVFALTLCSPCLNFFIYLWKDEKMRKGFCLWIKSGCVIAPVPTNGVHTGSTPIGQVNK